MVSIFILSSYTQAQQLKLTIEGDTTWYCISTPNRENLHLTSHGNNQEVTEQTLNSITINFGA